MAVLNQFCEKSAGEAKEERSGVSEPEREAVGAPGVKISIKGVARYGSCSLL